jgi:hypothetical protein
VAFVGEGFHPAVVIVRALTQDFFAEGVDVVDVAEEVDDVLGGGEQGQMTEDDDPVETVLYQGQQAAKQLCKGLHRSSPVVLGNKIIGQATGGNQSTPPPDRGGKKGFKGKKRQVAFPCSAHESAPPRKVQHRSEPFGFQNFKYLWVGLGGKFLVKNEDCVK